MGGFYGNITLKGASREAVAQTLRGHRAIVASTVGDYTVVFDSVCDEQDIEQMQALASRISGELRCVALAVVVHDDDVFGYFLYRDGKLIDWYNSCPSYFESTESPADPAGGVAEQLCLAFGVDKQQKVETILRKSRGKSGYVFETARHKDLVSLLALPNIAVGNALASFDDGKYPEGVSAEQVLWAADAPSAEDDRRKKRDRKFYDGLGLEDSSHKCRHEGCDRGVVRFSVFCKRHHFEMIEHRDCPFDH